jgi:hypothetical protein
VAKVSEESREDIAKSVRKIPAIANIKSSLTMIVAEKDHSMKQIEEETVAYDYAKKTLPHKNCNTDYKEVDWLLHILWKNSNN